MSTTTISLPRPFILTKAWLASALIGACHVALYGENCALGQRDAAVRLAKARRNPVFPAHPAAPLSATANPTFLTARPRTAISAPARGQKAPRFGLRRLFATWLAPPEPKID